VRALWLCLLVTSCGGYHNVSRWGGCTDGQLLVSRGWIEEGAYATLAVKSEGGLDTLRLDGTPGVVTEYIEMSNGAVQYSSRDLAGALKLTSEDGQAMTFAIKAVARNPEVDVHDVGDRAIAGEFTAVRARNCQ
jgi:hypothetical protein